MNVDPLAILEDLKAIYLLKQDGDEGWITMLAQSQSQARVWAWRVMVYQQQWILTHLIPKVSFPKSQSFTYKL